jgi:hypothetical protein
VFPSVNALSENLARSQRVRGDRLAASLDIHNPHSASIGGPAPDPAWDALWGALQEQDDVAQAAGMKSKIDFRGVSPAVSGLRMAARPQGL